MKLEMMLKLMGFKKWEGEKKRSPQFPKEIIQYTYKKDGEYRIDYYIK